MLTTAHLFEIFGGLALFLFGLHTLSSNLKKCFGDRLKNWLKKLTDRSYKGALFGAGITSIIQSSSITMVTVLGLINAGLLTLRQAIGVMLGAEVGTTVTVQLVAFDIGIYYFPLIILGFGLFLFGNRDFFKYLGKVILGFGLLFFGMQVMKSGVAPLESSSFFIQLLENFGNNPLLAVLAGALFTGVIQSSSGTVGLVVAMGMQNMITLPVAIAITFGANIGTCVTALLASIKSSLSGKRAAVSQLTVNIIMVVVFLLLLKPLIHLVTLTSSNLPRQIANAHAIINITATLAFLPLVGLLVALVKKIVPGEVVKVEQGTEYIDEKVLNTPGIALSQAFKETGRMAEISRSMLNLAYKAWDDGKKKDLKIIFKKEEAVDEIEEEIDSFVTELSSKPVSQSQSQQLALVQHSVVDIERVADHANNIAEFIEEKRSEDIQFSKQAQKELKEMFTKTKENYDQAVQALENEDEETAQRVLETEKEINKLEAKFKETHRERLEENICSGKADPIYVGMLTNLERVSDHAENIAEGILMGF